MSTCPSCGAATTADLRFCVECGTALGRRCPSCDAATQPGMRFCGQCGTRLSAGPGDRATREGQAAGTPASAVDASPGVPSEVERRLVSVLFADLVGSTTTAEGIDPEEVRDALTRYFEAANQVIARYGGTVEKFIGDAVMAVWGTPTAHEDDAERAVRAALDMIEAVRSIARPGANGDHGASAMELRAAVMTGDAAVTLGATGQGMVAGDLVNSASRLQALADPGTVLVDEATKQAADLAIAFDAAGERTLRGRTQPVSTWRALRVVAERGGQGRSLGIEPPFVGREEELRLLKDQLHATGRDGRARLVTVIGAAGLGKSRLVWEFSKYADGVTEDIFWHVGRSIPYGEGVAYWALGEMVRRRAGIAESEPEATARAKLAQVVAGFVPDAQERGWVERNLSVLLGLSGALPGERDEQFAAWRRFFERIAERGTTVLVFEDLHWADQGLLDFIESLLEWSRGYPILVVGLGRPELLERRPAWGTSGRASITMHLEAVDGRGMTDLVQGTVPGLPHEAVEGIAERSEGVPLFAVETIRMLVDEGRLIRDGDRYRLADPDAPFAVPPSLQALIAARLDAVEPEERSLLVDASVLGRTFPTRALAAVHGAEEARVDATLAALARKELVVRDTDPRSPERDQYGFVHGLVRDVAYGRLSRRDRLARHLAAARYFEQLEDDELSGVVARHYLDAWRAAGDDAQGSVIADRARVALKAAAERAMALHANSTAVESFEQALAVTTDPGERAAILLRMTEPAEAALGVVAGMRYLREAIAWYESQGDVASTDEALIRLVRSLNQSLDPLEARRLITPVVERLADGPATTTTAAAWNELARTHLFTGDYAQGLAFLERGLEIAEQLGAYVTIAELLVSKAWALAGVGRPREAAAIVLGGLDMAERAGSVVTMCRARVNASNWYLEEDPRRGLEIAATGIDLARSVGHAEWAAGLSSNASQAALALGEWDRVVAWREELDGPSVSANGRLALHGWAWVVDGYRGADATDVYERPMATDRLASPATQELGAIHAIAALVRFAAGDLDQVAEPAIRAYHEYPEVEGAIAMLVAARAAILSRDVDVLRKVMHEMREGTTAGAWLATRRSIYALAIDWLEGRAGDAEQAYRAAISTFRAMGLVPEVAFTELELLALAGDDLPDREALREDAIATLQDLGVGPLLERLSRSAAWAAGDAVGAGARPAR